MKGLSMLMAIMRRSGGPQSRKEAIYRNHPGRSCRRERRLHRFRLIARHVQTVHTASQNWYLAEARQHKESDLAENDPSCANPTIISINQLGEVNPFESETQ